jgi:hypothetical protein
VRVFANLAIFLMFSSVTVAQAIPSLTPKQWIQELHHFADEIRTEHRDPYHLISKDRFDSEVATLESRIPLMKDYEVVVGLQRLASLIGDGDTFVDTSKLYRRLPIEAFWFGENLRVVRASREYQKAIGTKIVKIGPTSINEVQRKLQQLIPQGESEWFVMDRSAGLITQIEPLAALHIIPYSDITEFTFETDSGSRFTLQLRADAPGNAPLISLGAQVPLPFQHPDEPFWLPIYRIRRLSAWIFAPIKTSRNKRHTSGHSSRNTRQNV